MSLDNLGEFTNRGASTESGGTVVAEPPPPSTTADQGAPPPTLAPTPEPKVDVTPSKPETFMADIVTAFQKSIPEEGAQATTEPTKAPVKPPEKPETKPEDTKAEEPPEGRYGLPETPANLSDRGRRNWKNFEVKAVAQIEEREKRIKELQGEINSQREALTVDQDEVKKLREELAGAHKTLEQTAIERSPMFKQKVLDQQDMIRNRIGAQIEGTSLTPGDVQKLIAGDIRSREEVLERGDLSAYRKSQIIGLLDKWDSVEQEKNSMLANGRASYQEHMRKLQLEEEARKAQFVRESTAMFEDAMTTLAPKIDPYQPIEGNQAWNDGIPKLKTAARQIFNGEVDKKVLAEVAILAPAAVVYHRVILPAAMKRIQELTSQIERMRGVNPSVTDRGGDSAPTIPKSASGDFVKDLVDRFRKESGS